jgi:elongator complex protein 3
MGLGKRLLTRAAEIAQEKGYRRLSVIAAVGTREYYLGRGFCRGEHYLIRELPA